MTPTQRAEARSKEPVSRCLIRHLLVPCVYWDAPWPASEPSVDLLAIDRAGTGDIHIVEIKRRAADAIKAIPKLMQRPAHYRWIAFFADTADRKTDNALLGPRVLFPSEGPGRIGVIEIVRKAVDTLSATIKIPAERFPGSLDKQAESFKAANKPDISFD